MGLGEDPGWGPPKGIDVDVTGLDKFAGSVESEIEGRYQPEAGRLMSIYSMGADFGANTLSHSVAAAIAKHEQCLQAAANQLAGYGNATKILVDAAREVAARYRRTDALAVASAQEVDGALSAATKAAEAARAQAMHEALAQAAQVTGLVGIPLVVPPLAEPQP